MYASRYLQTKLARCNTKEVGSEALTPSSNTHCSLSYIYILQYSYSYEYDFLARTTMSNCHQMQPTDNASNNAARSEVGIDKKRQLYLN